jgi:hypothetical protein
MSVNLIVHSFGEGKDSLTGKDAKDGAVVTLNGRKRFYSKKSLWQLVGMELEGKPREEEADIFNGPVEAMPVR